MKNIFKAFILCMMLSPFFSMGQTLVNGTVTDKANAMPLPGVNVIIKDTSRGASTDFDGKYSIEVNDGDIIVVSYVGYASQEITFSGQTNIDITLEEDAAQLDEIVLIGYGSTTKKDATGSVDVVGTKDFNKGVIVSTDQLLNGKAAGVRITTAGGSPDSAPNIRIRGGSSLNAENNPLIVIDGVPIGNDNPAGVSNPLTLVNPNDIESFSILKDASATAIYGSRASNGVIIITTKKGTSGGAQYNLSMDYTFSEVGDGLEVMNGNDFTRFVQQFHPTRAVQLGVPVGSVQNNENFRIVDIDVYDPDGNIVGTTQRQIYNTNWRDAILRQSSTTNVNFSARTNLFGAVPFRGSMGYTSAGGVVRNDDYERLTTSIKLSPKILNDNLKIDLNAKGIFAFKNALDTDGAISEALSFDPTQPIFDNSPSNRFGGYYLTTFDDGNFRRILQNNPLARIEQRERDENVYRFLGNLEFDYTLPFLPELRAVVNLGLDASGSIIEERFGNNAFETYQFNQNNNDIDNNFLFNPGVNYREVQNIANTTFDAYLQYSKDLSNKVISKYDVQAGYSYQNFKNDGIKDEFQYNPETGIREEIINPLNVDNRYYNVLNLQSYFARANVSVLEKYLLTVSFRADGSSLFSEDNRWGYFPAAALAWKIDEESFLQNVEFINQLKLRLGWGETGQQDITGDAGFYPYFPLFIPGEANSQYLPGTSLYSAEPFNPNLTWEKTTTYNLGIDFSLFKNGLLSGSLDVYRRNTRDLLALVPVPPGQALTNEFIDNVGETESEGFELNLNLDVINNENMNLALSGNISYNNTEITNLGGPTTVLTGENLGGTGTALFRNTVGEQARSAYVFKQIYDQNGDPIQNAFVDRNGDGVITNDDRYHVAMAPNWTYGFSLNFNYKNWDLSSSFRGQIGGHVYNFAQSDQGYINSAIFRSQNNLTNVLNFYDGSANPNITDIIGDIRFSDHFIEDASFLRCDNIALGYRFNNLLNNGNLRVYAAVTNPFIITDYSGQDPENFDGLDRNFYPRPVSYTFGMNLDF